MIISGDIGGTKCNLAAYVEHSGSLRQVFKQRYSTRDFSSFEHLIETFTEHAFPSVPNRTVIAAGFGVPGTVVDGRLHAAHIPWVLDATSLAARLKLPHERVVLMNDLVATARGLQRLAPEDILYLNRGIDHPEDNIAVIAAGTGLGEAVLYWDGHGHRAAPSEGGSADFAPRSDREIAFLTFLKKRLTRVSCEELFSGRGFRPIHEFLAPDIRHASFAGAAGESAQEIAQNALTGSCAACVETLEFWTDAFGAESGNLALRVLAYGGVYLAGGIAVKILPLLQKSSFCTAFADKGPLGPILQNIPIAVVLNEDAPILGAAYAALHAAR
ncbi:MAG TPA: glucokinase [Candidatus Dormibacteraeota bacterium]|nr:glucokinase [Candidatus Dormibacteraeota bacterium]